DPVYIPPLTLATTLVDEYGVAGATLGNNNPPYSLTSNSAAAPATLSAATRSAHDPGEVYSGRARSTAGLQPDSKPQDFLSEFNATYNYIFGSPPSETVLESQTSQVTQDNGLLSPSSITRAPLKGWPKADSAASEDEDYATAMGSDDSSSSDEGGNSAADRNSVHEKELEEERRKDEERKAAELRSRRREMIKQQVAFERMKERHRRQYPGQQPAAGPHNSIMRWQKESARAVGTISSMQLANGAARNQGALHTSNSTINKGGHASGVPQSPNQQPFGSGMAGGQRGDIASGAIPGRLLRASAHANSSMPNMAAYSLQFQQQQQIAQLYEHVQPGIQQPAQDIVPGQLASGTVGYVPGSPQNAHALNGNHPAMVMPPGSQALISNTSHELAENVSSHPVKLASVPKRAKNYYLSDSSDDGDDASSNSDLSNDDSDGSGDISSMESSAISCGAGAPIPAHAARLPSNSSAKENAAVLHKVALSDSSSDASAKSQASSKRRVRFHDTVSVVFNTRRSAAGEDTECGAYGSDSNSSDASVGLSIGNKKGQQAGPPSSKASTHAHSTANTKVSTDDAFDGEDAMNHTRYHIPAYTTPVKKNGSALWLDGDATTVNSSKSSSAESIRNISPDGAKSRSRRSVHRFKTEPLRDREAEREQQEQKRQHENSKTSNNAAGSGPNSTPLRDSNHDAMATIAKADVNTSSAVFSCATEPANPAVDHVAEARRALLGHYHAPGSLFPVGAGIPRSVGTRPAYTSSVKVLGPQSFSRPKKSYSKSGTLASSEKSVERSRSFVGRQSKSQSQKKTVDNPAEDTKQKAADAPRADPNSSREFELGNVLQNFSISSFEVRKDKDGGMHIHYSDKSNNTGTGTTSSKAREANGDNDSDGDELPLSAIVRSMSEPTKYMSGRPSEESNAYRSEMGKDKRKKEYVFEERLAGSGENSNNSSPKVATLLFGRSSIDKSRQVLVRNQSAAKGKTGVAHAIKHEEVARSVSMDGGVCIPPTQDRAEGKRRFTRLGAFFS
ncbi:hypothetical protein GGI22_004176, partial [Coemansia erecta]